MSAATRSPNTARSTEPLDYDAAEGFLDDAQAPVTAPADVRREWTLVGLGLTALIAVVVGIVSVVALVTAGDRAGAASTAATPVAPHDHGASASGSTTAAAPTLADAQGIAFEKFSRVDPKLPAVPAGAVKTFKVDVFHHVTQVSKDLAPTEVWSYAVNGVKYRGSGASPPMVVNEGDTVDFTLVNGSTTSMKVNLPHSLDFHSAEVDPGTRYGDLAPGKSMRYRFTADHPGVFMYHCATQPVLLHTGAGMSGMFVVKPKGLPAVDRELWATQQEFYIGKPGGQADQGKLKAKQPDVIAFNGYADQYKDTPISVRKGERIRMYVLNAGPSIWSGFHVIGTVFDKVHTDNGVARHVQTINLAPSQGGWVEFTLDEEGTYPFVTHAFGDMVKGALGVLKTPGAAGGHGH